MVLRIAQQHGKYRCRRGRGRAVVAVADGRVDLPAQRLALGTFQHGEKAAQPVGRVGGFLVQTHGDLLLVTVDSEAALTRQNAFADTHAQPRQMAIAAHAHQHVGQQAARIGAAGEHGAHELAHEIAHGVIHLGCAALTVRCRGQHHAVSRGRGLPGHRLQMKVLRVLRQAARKQAQRADLPETDGDARGIGRQAQHVHARVFLKPGVDVAERPAFLHLLQFDADARGLLVVRGTVIEQVGQQRLGPYGLFGLLAICSLGPEDDAGITDLQALAVMLAAPQQVVEHGGAGKGGLLRDRCVVALAFAVGSE